MMMQTQTVLSNQIVIYWQLTIVAIIIVPLTLLSALTSFHLC